LSLGVVASIALVACSTSRTHVGGETDMPLANKQTDAPVEEGGLARCPKRLGTMAIAEAEGNAQALMSAGLPRSIAPLVRYMLASSQCFKVVDRGAAFTLLEQERKVYNERGLAMPPNRRPLQAVDYILRAEIVFAEQTGSSKGVIGAVFGNAIGGVAGQYNKKEAIVLLSVVDAQTSEIVTSTFGRGSSDASGLGSLILGSGAVLIDGIWADTPQAKTVAAALMDSWNRSLPKLTAFAAQQEALNPPPPPPSAAASAASSASAPETAASAASTPDIAASAASAASGV
jgi:curli biogenesis system outer membrane secretion channel CsgG